MPPPLLPSHSLFIAQPHGSTRWPGEIRELLMRVTFPAFQPTQWGGGGEKREALRANRKAGVGHITRVPLALTNPQVEDKLFPDCEPALRWLCGSS